MIPRGGPTDETVAVLDAVLDRQSRVAGMRLATLGASVRTADDVAGFTRLTVAGTRAIVAAQDAALRATGAYLIGTLADNEVPGDGVVIPIDAGRLKTGQPVERFMAGTQPSVAARIDAGANFVEAMQSSLTIVTNVGATEPYRIARRGAYLAGAGDDRFSRWIRVAEPGACDFCRMLASRGAVYYSRTSATFGHTADKGHTNCRCQIVEVTSEALIGLSIVDGAELWRADRAAGTAWRAPDSKVPGTDTTRRDFDSRPYSRASDVDQQLRVLRRQVDDGTATAWTRERIALLESEQATGIPDVTETWAEFKARAA